MTITSATVSVVGTGNGLATVWPYTFLIPDADSVEVLVRVIATGVDTAVDSADYTITGLGDSAGGSVTYPLSGSPLASTHQLVINRTVPYTQTTSISNQTRFYADTVEDVWDRLTMLAQQLASDSERSLKLPAGETAVGSIPGALGRAGKFVYFDETTGAMTLADSVPAAVTAKNAAEAAQTGAEAAEAKAEKWAAEVEDTEVETGKYSALHYAAKADDSATLAAGYVSSIGGLSPVDSAFVVGDGTNFITESGATARTSLGLASGATTTVGTIATQDANNVAITGGSITGVTGIDTIPTGFIGMWSGSVATIPSGWALCDGTNGTPDLTGKFVVHADADTGGTYAPGATGGQNSITDVPAHSHSFSGSTNSTGAHTHTVTQVSGSTYVIAGASFAESAGTIDTGSAGAHSHTVSGTVASAGVASVDVRPPYYALAYIMKL